MTSWLLTSLIFLPLFGALVCLLIPKEEVSIHRGIGLFTSLCTFFLSLGLVLPLFSNGIITKESLNLFQVDIPWISSLGIHYKLGIDGISLWLILLTTFLMPIVFVSIKTSISHRVRELIICLLLLETGILGAFISLDIFLFYVFWEVMLIPMYFIIGIWGGEKRIYASIKFVLYTMFGSLVMLAAILYLYIKGHTNTGVWTFDYLAWQNLSLSSTEQLFCFIAFALAFLIKVPLFPFHTWLPDAHVEAPTSGSVILAGVLLKFGIYGLLRFGFPLFPSAVATLSPYLAILAVVGIIYGSLVAYNQTDMKKLIAYSSVAHMGIVVLGICMLNGKAISGAIYQMLAHGISTGGLFLCVGVLYERRHTRKMEDYGGVWQKMPVFGAFFLIFLFASIGLPGLSGFPGEFLILIGSMSAEQSSAHFNSVFPYARLFCALAATGVVLSAAYMLTLFQKVMLGPIRHAENEHLTDLSWREKGYLLPMIVMAFWLGIYPATFLKSINPTVSDFVSTMKTKILKSRNSVFLLNKPKVEIFQVPPPVHIPAPSGGH